MLVDSETTRFACFRPDPFVVRTTAATQSPRAVQVLELHYRHLEKYISAIYGLTTAAFKDDSDDVAMQARRPFLALRVLCLLYTSPSPRD